MHGCVPQYDVRNREEKPLRLASWLETNNAAASLGQGLVRNMLFCGVLFFDAPLTFQEFIVREDVPLADVFRVVLAFIVGRDDAVLFGAQAVNAYCEPPRMTGDIDLMSTRARSLAEDIRALLAGRFGIAVRVREVAAGEGFRIYQLRKPKNRHLVDVRQVGALPPARSFEGVQVVAPVELVALKVQSIAARKGREKELSDRLDLHRLLRVFPDLRADDGEVTARLRGLGAANTTLELWRTLAAERVEPDRDDEY